MTPAASHSGYRFRRRSALTAAGICFGLLFGGTASALDGRVIDAVTGAPIAAATVTVGDKSQASDSGGLFRIDGADNLSWRARQVTAPAAFRGPNW
jgi:hypothetical protein